MFETKSKNFFVDKKMTPLCLQQEEIQQSARISIFHMKKSESFQKERYCTKCLWENYRKVRFCKN